MDKCPVVIVGENTNGWTYWCEKCGNIQYEDGGKEVHKNYKKEDCPNEMPSV